MKKLITVIATVVFLNMAASAQAMTISAYGGDPNHLVNAILGSGISYSNATYTGADVASGYFSGGTAAGIGIESGIVLTSGLASNLHGTTNTSDSITGDNGLDGDATLGALVPGYTTYDATVLEFDFTSTGGDVYFNYVFGSDEYNEWVGSAYNDVFGFFLDGTAITDNLALIPGTTTPVSINNVNNGSYAGYYNDNDFHDVAGANFPYPFEYDGFTDVLTAQFKGLSAGNHTIKLAIADAGDRFLDAGVFIQAGSFSDTDPTIPEPSTLLLLSTGILGGLVRRRKKA